MVAGGARFTRVMLPGHTSCLNLRRNVPSEGKAPRVSARCKKTSARDLRDDSILARSPSDRRDAPSAYGIWQVMTPSRANVVLLGVDEGTSAGPVYVAVFAPVTVSVLETFDPLG